MKITKARDIVTVVVSHGHANRLLGAGLILVVCA